jgi:hypothetical protein
MALRAHDAVEDVQVIGMPVIPVEKNVFVHHYGNGYVRWFFLYNQGQMSFSYAFSMREAELFSELKV